MSILASGKYVRVSIDGPTILGNRQFKFTVRYWSSSSQVWNSDGQDIILEYQSSADSGTVTLETLWGSNLSSYTSESNSWSTTYTYTAPSSVTSFNIYAITQDRSGDSNFYAKTSNLNVQMSTITSPNITSTTATSCTLNVNMNNLYDEELKYQDAQGNYQVKNLSASSSTRTVSFTVNNMPYNSAYNTRYYGHIIPNGSANSPYVWGSGTYKIRTSFSKMSIPNISVSRDSDNPTRLNVSWPAGGTTNKPTGDASRIQYVIAIEADKNGTLNMNNIKYGSTINLEVAGSGYIDNVDIDKRWGIYAEYRVDGLGASSSDHYFQKTNIVYIEPLIFNPYLKINNEYKKCTEGYIKTNNEYKKIEKAYLKINGEYKEIN